VARALTAAELQELLGAYALDAVDDDERAQIEAWLARSANARRDADELRETASLLAQSDDDVPADLWARIETHLGDPADPIDASTGRGFPPLRLGEVVDLGARRDATPPARRSRRRPWLVGVAAALALVVAVGVGVVAGSRLDDQDQRIDQLAVGMEKRSMERAALAATMQPGARMAELAASDADPMMAKVVVTPDGHGYLMSDGLPRLAAGRTYQLWAVMGDAPGSAVVSAGVMGAKPGVMAFTTDAGVTGFVVTEEPSPGVVRSTQPPMLQGRLA
jgi:hypothetical protein